MRTIRSITILCAVCIVSLQSVGLAQKHPSELADPKELSFKPPKPVEFDLSNGIHVFYFEDRELPLISINGMFRGGSLYDPSDKSGLASLTGNVWRTGGTKTLTGDQLDEELEFLAASVETNMGDEYANASASCLKKDIKRVMEIYADVVLNPEFRQEKIDLAKNQTKEGIRRRWDMPAQISSILFTEQLLGDTPYGRRISFKSVNGIMREDMVAFHNRFIAPNNMNLSIVGDLSKDEAKSMLEAAFKGWKKKDVKIPEVAKLNEKADGTVYSVPKDAPQASVYIGHLGVKRNNPDESKIEVMNDIFGGGGFTARLMKEIRSNRGLTYGIYGGVFTGKDRGLFRISSQLKADRCVEALALVRDMIKELQDTPVPDEELELSKKSLINSFVFRFESKERLASEYMMLKLNGYPDDYFDKYIGKVNGVGKKDVQEMAKKYMDTEKMIILVVGDEKKFDKPLSTLGKVQEIDYKKIAEADKAEK